ncbi:MAG: hypothetical protein ABII12_07120 [Planctomycetota bacterium]
MTEHASDRGPTRVIVLRAVALAVLLLALRIPLWQHPTPVQSPDEENFMLALGFPADYPVHHPGYPLWVALGTLLHATGIGAYASYQVWSLAASIAAPVLLYAGLRRLLNDGLAWWLAMAFGVNPLLWFQATTALTYPTAAVFGLIVIGLCLRALQNRQARSASCAAIVLAIGVFLRADLLVFLGPMVVFTACRCGRRAVWTTVLPLIAGVAGYMAVTTYLYGRAESAAPRPDLSHTVDVILGTSVLKLGLVDGLLRNLVKIVLNLSWDLGVAVLLLPVAVVGVARGRTPWVGTVLLLWVVPSLTFLLLLHEVQGYFMLLLPAAYCVIGLALQNKYRPATAMRVAAAIAICSAAQFSLWPWSAEGTGLKRLLDAKIAFQSASGLRQIDQRPTIHEPGDFWHTAAHEATSTQPAGAHDNDE